MVTSLKKETTILERLAEKTMSLLDTPLDRCSLEQIKKATEELIKEDEFFSKEDTESAYYGLLEF